MSKQGTHACLGEQVDQREGSYDDCDQRQAGVGRALEKHQRLAGGEAALHARSRHRGRVGVCGGGGCRVGVAGTAAAGRNCGVRQTACTCAG